MKSVTAGIWRVGRRKLAASPRLAFLGFAAWNVWTRVTDNERRPA